MNELEQPIHLAFKNEIDFIFRYQKKLHYLNTSTKFFKKLNALKFLSLYGFIFCIFPITGLVLISSFFQKNFNPKTTYNDVSLELYVMTNFYSLPFPAMFYTFIPYIGYNAYELFKLHVAFAIVGIILIFSIYLFLLQFSNIYFTRMIRKISQRRNNEFTPFFSNLDKIDSFKIKKIMLLDSNIFFKYLFYIFYQHKYAEDKHLFISNHHDYKPPCEFHEMYACCLKNEKHYMFFDYLIDNLPKSEITEAINYVVTIKHQHDFDNSLKNYLTDKKREHMLISKLNISEKDRIRKKQKI